MNNSKRPFWGGFLLVALFSLLAVYISKLPFMKTVSLSPLIIGIILGMIYGNTFRHRLPETWVSGILFCSKQLLRTAIIFYGFRLTFQHIVAVGPSAIIVDVIMVCSVLIIGYFTGRILKLDPHISTLTTAGSAICGAAAVLGTEPVLKSKPHKTALQFQPLLYLVQFLCFYTPFSIISDG